MVRCSFSRDLRNATLMPWSANALLAVDRYTLGARTFFMTKGVLRLVAKFCLQLQTTQAAHAGFTTSVLARMSRMLIQHTHGVPTAKRSFKIWVYLR